MHPYLMCFFSNCLFFSNLCLIYNYVGLTYTSYLCISTITTVTVKLLCELKPRELAKYGIEKLVDKGIVD